MIALHQLKIWDGRSVENMSVNVCAKFRCASLRIKKALGIFRELITTRRTTWVAFWDPPSGYNNLQAFCCPRWAWLWHAISVVCLSAGLQAGGGLIKHWGPRVRAYVCPCVCPSVCASVCSRNCEQKICKSYERILLNFWRDKARGGSRKKYLGGLAPHHLGGNDG